MAGIIWLASYPKSGNTWTRAFLANHFANLDKPVEINALPLYCYGDSIQKHYAQISGKPYESLSIDEIHRLRPMVHKWLTTASRNDIFVKTHNVIGSVNQVPLITPAVTVGAIYIIRNPFDVAVSFAHHYQVTIDRAVEIMCEPNQVLPPTGDTVPQFIGSWGDHAKSWREARGMKLHLMRYEDMLAKPIKAFGSLTKFLGLPDNRKRLKKAIDFSSFKELAGQESKTRFVESRPDGSAKFFRAGKAGSWRDSLTDAHVAQFVEAFGPLMHEMGYLKPNGQPNV